MKHFEIDISRKYTIHTVIEAETQEEARKIAMNAAYTDLEAAFDAMQDDGWDCDNISIDITGSHE